MYLKADEPEVKAKASKVSEEKEQKQTDFSSAASFCQCHSLWLCAAGLDSGLRAPSVSGT
jgi:hypothetical protein